ncbi:MAG: hypothetical protein IT353_02905 [Gemmatimonadaceae bacterium]|nr:hypothetical protein [Gemmatimonadaceae bacterium]
MAKALALANLDQSCHARPPRVTASEDKEENRVDRGNYHSSPQLSAVRVAFHIE